MINIIYAVIFVEGVMGAVIGSLLYRRRKAGNTKDTAQLLCKALRMVKALGGDALFARRDIGDAVKFDVG